MDPVQYHPVGIVHSPFSDPEGAPIQPAAAEADVAAEIEIFSEFAAGLKDLDGFSHLMVLFHCHRSGAPELLVTPFLDNTRRGVFATRAPSRPNAIGFSVVRLISIDGVHLHIRECDILDGAPVLDIKPWVPRFDCRENVRCGWLETRCAGTDAARDDGRFAGFYGFAYAP